MAVRFGCPIYTFDSILAKAGVMLDAEFNPLQEEVSNEQQDKNTDKNNDLVSMSLDELNLLLEDVLEHEDYIRAISIRDEIKSRGRN